MTGGVAHRQAGKPGSRSLILRARVLQPPATEGYRAQMGAGFSATLSNPRFAVNIFPTPEDPNLLPTSAKKHGLQLNYLLV